MKTEIKYGVAGAAVASVWAVVHHAAGIDAIYEIAQYTRWIDILLLLPVLFFGMKEKRDKEFKGFLTFDEGLRTGLFIAVAFGITYTIFSFVHQNYISPDIIETRIRHDRNSLVAGGSWRVGLLLSQLRMFYGSPMYWIHTFLSMVVTGIVGSFGTSIILKNISPNGFSRWKPTMVLSIGLLAIALNLMCVTCLPFRVVLGAWDFLGSFFLGVIGLIVALVVWISDRQSIDTSGKSITKWGLLCTTVSLVGTVVLFEPVLFGGSHYGSDKDKMIDSFNAIGADAYRYRSVNGSYDGYRTKLPQKLLDPDGIGMVFETQTFRDSIILKGRILDSENAAEVIIDADGKLKEWKYWGDWQ